jgi:hypothetical protein|tara:strand:+ start:424 stop:714 length:291 start_codon:yes stop_codon:yes gene_type:complete
MNNEPHDTCGDYKVAPPESVHRFKTIQDLFLINANMGAHIAPTIMPMTIPLLTLPQIGTPRTIPQIMPIATPMPVFFTVLFFIRRDTFNSFSIFEK